MRCRELPKIQMFGFWAFLHSVGTIFVKNRADYEKE